MKLSKLKRLTEGEQPPNENDRMQVYKNASERFVETIKKYKKEYLFWKKIDIPEGEINSSLMTELVPFTPDRFKEGVLGELLIKIDFMPKMDPNPVIPLNILQVVMENLMDDLLEVDPDLLNPSVYPVDLLNMYHLKFMGMNVFPGNGILHMRDYMDVPTYNLKMLSPNPFGDILFSRSHLKNVYSLVQGDLPTFADDYASSMSKLVSKAKHVFQALKKGTWRGHTYELETPYNWRSGIVLHQDRHDYNKTDKIIHGNFSPSLSLAWEYVDGKKNSPEETVLSAQERDEFRDWLKKRFEHFGIKY